MTPAKIKTIKRLRSDAHLAPEQIAARMGCCVSTVYKYLADPPEVAATADAPAAPKPRLADKYTPVIREWLTADKDVYFKQRHTAKRVYERLAETFPDFNASYSSVLRLYREIEGEIYRNGESRDYDNLRPAGVAEISCSPMKTVINGVSVKASVMIFCFPFSNSALVQVLPSLSVEYLLTAMQAAFSRIGGVPTKIRFTPSTGLFFCDEHEISEPTSELFMRFVLYYNFADDYIMPYHENYKTTSAALLGFIRRKLKLSDGIKIKDLSAFNADLLAKCDAMQRRIPNHNRKATCGELFERDRAKLAPLPEKTFEVALWTRRKINALCELAVDRQIYVLPQNMKNRTVFLKQTAERLELYALDYSPIITLERVYSDDVVTTSDPVQLLCVLRRKPNAVLNSPLKKYLSAPLCAFFSSAPTKQKVGVLRAMYKIALADGLEKALLIGEKSVTAGAFDCDKILESNGYAKENG